MRIYLISAASLEGTIAVAQELLAGPGDTACEVRPIAGMSGMWIDAI